MDIGKSMSCGLTQKDTKRFILSLILHILFFKEVLLSFT